MVVVVGSFHVCARAHDIPRVQIIAISSIADSRGALGMPPEPTSATTKRKNPVTTAADTASLSLAKRARKTAHKTQIATLSTACTTSSAAADGGAGVAAPAALNTCTTKKCHLCAVVLEANYAKFYESPCPADPPCMHVVCTACLDKSPAVGKCDNTNCLEPYHGCAVCSTEYNEWVRGAACQYSWHRSVSMHVGDRARVCGYACALDFVCLNSFPVVQVTPFCCPL